MTATVGGRKIRSGGRDGVTTHGMAGTKIYNIWCDMVARCHRPSHPRWKDYGGRGLTVSPRWREFSNFYADVGDRPDGRSLDRKDNDRGYSPANCRWATPAEQVANQRSRRPISADCRHGVIKNGPERCKACDLDARRARAKRARS